MIKKKNSKYSILWKRLHFKYRLSATNENTLDEVWTIHVSIFSGVVLLIVFASIVIFITSFIIIATPIRYYLPGYLDAEVRRGAINAAIRADSLEKQIRYQEIYVDNLKSIFAGERSSDSVKVIDTLIIETDNPLLTKTEREKAFAKQYEEKEKYNLSVLSSTIAPSTEGTLFFKPVKGVINKTFNPVLQQYGIEIQTSAKESILAVLDGTVISAGYNIDDKYIIQIQHKNGFVSVYKNNSMLIKQIGDKVRTGEAIAVIEENKEKTMGDNHLYFELWFKGNAINPTDYISF